MGTLKSLLEEQYVKDFSSQFFRLYGMFNRDYSEKFRIGRLTFKNKI